MESITTNQQGLSSLVKSLSRFYDLKELKIIQNLPKKVALIVGPAGTGKTSFLHYINSSQLKPQFDDYGDSMLNVQSSSETIINFPFICKKVSKNKEEAFSIQMQLNFSINGDAGSEPEKIPNKTLNSVTKKQEMNNSVLILQIPEFFFDNQGSQEQENTLDIIQILLGNLLKQAQCFHIFFMIQSSQLDNGAVALRQIYTKFMDSFVVSEESLDMLKQSISVVLTKGQQQDDSPIFLFNDVIKELSNDQQQGQKSAFLKYLSDANQNQRIYLFSNVPVTQKGHDLLEIIKSSSFIASQKFSLTIFKQSNNIQKIQTRFTQILNQGLQSFSNLIRQINLMVLDQGKNNKIFSLKQHHPKITQYLTNYHQTIQHYFQLILIRASEGEQIAYSTPNFKQQDSQDQKQSDINASKMFAMYLLQSTQKIQEILPLLAIYNFKPIIEQILEYAKSCFQFFRNRQMNKKQIESIVKKIIKLKCFSPQQTKKLLANKNINEICINKQLLFLTQLKQQLNQVKKTIRRTSTSNERTYQEVRKQFQSLKLEQIMQKLPNKVLKFDFIHNQLAKLVKKQQKSQQNDSQSSFYQIKILTHQIIKILQFQAFHEEAVMFMMVIPDFNRIQQILNEAIYYKSQNDPKADYYAPKFQFSIEFLTRLEKFCVRNLRDSIAFKCVQLKTERSQKSAVMKRKREQFKNSLKKRIKEKQFQLQKDRLTFYMNFKNHGGHEDILSQDFRKKIIEKGLSYHEKNNDYLHLLQFLKKHLVPS